MWDQLAKCEAGGNWADNTGNGHDGINSGGVNRGVAGSTADGDAAMSFNATDGHIAVAKASPGAPKGRKSMIFNATFTATAASAIIIGVVVSPFA